MFNFINSKNLYNPPTIKSISNINSNINLNSNSNIILNDTLKKEKIVLKSSPITLNDTPKNEKDEIYLIYQYYLPNTEKRIKEVQEALSRNLENQHISKIYILTERHYTDKEFGLENPTDKIIQEVIGRRMIFRDVFTYVEKFNLKGYIMTSNSDIFFDNSISKLHYTDLDVLQTIISLLRWEYRGEKNLNDCKLYNSKTSQDSWIFHSNFKIPLNSSSYFDIQFGQPGCDNRLLYVFWKNGFLIKNDPIMFKTYHCHDDNAPRQYNTEKIEPPHLYVIPFITY
jgi:hypothetical protein